MPPAAFSCRARLTVRPWERAWTRLSGLRDIDSWGLRYGSNVPAGHILDRSEEAPLAIDE
ncbi:MAG: hypothetical protein K0S45_3513 [Nitrospira sp.]|jgi:hypothetical protein|nr:hypothetical protein [Nitrospira sp.]